MQEPTVYRKNVWHKYEYIVELNALVEGVWRRKYLTVGSSKKLTQRELLEELAYSIDEEEDWDESPYGVGNADLRRIKITDLCQRANVEKPVRVSPKMDFVLWEAR